MNNKPIYRVQGMVVRHVLRHLNQLHLADSRNVPKMGPKSCDRQFCDQRDAHLPDPLSGCHNLPGIEV